jgi:hypothetical protein
LTMPTATKTKIRTVRLARTDGGLALVIREQAEGGPLKVDAYYLTELPARAPDRRFVLSKHDTTRYEVLLRGAGGSCTCPWGRYGASRKPCRHVDAVRALVARGKL